MNLNISTVTSLGRPVNIYNILHNTHIDDPNKYNLVKKHAIEDIKPLGPAFILRSAVLDLMRAMEFIENEYQNGITQSGDWIIDRDFVPDWREDFIVLPEIYLNLGVDPNIYLRPQDTFKFFSYDSSSVNKISEYFDVEHPKHKLQMEFYKRCLNLYYKYYLPLARELIVKHRGGLYSGVESTIAYIPPELRELTEEYAIGSPRPVKMAFKKGKGSPKKKKVKSR